MKLFNGDIFTAKEPLEKLSEHKLPIKTSLAIAKMTIKLNEEFQAIEQVRQGLIRKYGEANKEDPNLISVKPESENYPKFVEEVTELLEQEVEVVIKKVKLPEEVDGKPLEIEPKILMALEKFIEV